MRSIDVYNRRTFLDKNRSYDAVGNLMIPILPSKNENIRVIDTRITVGLQLGQTLKIDSIRNEIVKSDGNAYDLAAFDWETV